MHTRAQDAIYVDVTSGDSGPGWRAAKGGAEVPLADDVYTLQPKSYVQEEGEAGEEGCGIEPAHPC